MKLTNKKSKNLSNSKKVLINQASSEDLRENVFEGSSETDDVFLNKHYVESGNRIKFFIQKHKDAQIDEEKAEVIEQNISHETESYHKEEPKLESKSKPVKSKFFGFFETENNSKIEEAKVENMPINKKEIIDVKEKTKEVLKQISIEEKHHEFIPEINKEVNFSNKSRDDYKSAKQLIDSGFAVSHETVRGDIIPNRNSGIENVELRGFNFPRISFFKKDKQIPKDISIDNKSVNIDIIFWKKILLGMLIGGCLFTFSLLIGKYAGRILNPNLSEALELDNLNKFVYINDNVSYETPQKYKISDITAPIFQNPVFKGVQNGDLLFVYEKSKKIIIFRESIKKIVSVFSL
jgi:hypothetical protein